MALSEAQLISYLQDALDDEALDAETEIFSTGLMDSVAMMNLIMFVEEKGGITVQAEDVTLENFDTPSRIMAYLQAQG